MSENYIIDIEDVTLTGMEVRDRDDWGIHIYEGEGSFTDKFQSMDFTTNGFDGTTIGRTYKATCKPH